MDDGDSMGVAGGLGLWVLGFRRDIYSLGKTNDISDKNECTSLWEHCKRMSPFSM